jgi:virulence factor
MTVIGSSSWNTFIKRRGFEDAIMHFINSIMGNTNPETNGEEAYKTQKLINDIMINE